MSETIQFDPALRHLLLQKTGDVSGIFPSEAIGVEEIPVVAKLAAPSVAVEALTVTARFGQVVTGRVALNRIVKVRQDPNIMSLKASENHEPDLAFSVPEIQASQVALCERLKSESVTGCGVVLGFADWGCDFAHANFRDERGGTRLLYLWDQRGGLQPESPGPFCYGREFSRDRINLALAEADPYVALDYDPADADPKGIGTHGTHVMDIAAGNGRAPGASPGVAPGADLIFVHLKGDDTRPGDTLGDSVRLLEAIRYIVDRAGNQPVVINMSLGRTVGPHDGKTLLEQGLDTLLEERPGRAIVMSTGNYFGADMHSSGQIKAGEYTNLRWRVTPRNDEIAKVDVWYSGADTFAVEVIDPTGRSLARVALGDNSVTRDGERIIVSIYHRRHDPNNGDNHCVIFLWADAMLGTWITRLHGETVTNGQYHAWIERDDPAFQSRFTRECAVQTSTTNTICNGFKTIAVGAYDAREASHPLVPVSSEGPTRDDRAKPDISAPGAGIRAARSSQPRVGYREMDGLTTKSGTSMAAPHVAGTVALMFEAAGEYLLSVEEARAILFKTARGSPPYNEFEHLRYGAGRVDAADAVKEVRAMRESKAALNALFSTKGAQAAAFTSPRVAESHGEDYAVVTDEEESDDHGELHDFDWVDWDDQTLRKRLAVILPILLVQFGDSELRRTDQYGVPLNDRSQLLVFGPTGRQYSLTAGRFNYHAANFVYNTAYQLGYDVPVYPLSSDGARNGKSYNNTAATFAALAGRARGDDKIYFCRFFNVIARPNQEGPLSIRVGDLLLCGPEPGAPFGHIAIIVDPTLYDMVSSTFRSADSRQGRGVQCIEAGISINNHLDRFGRVLTDEKGRILDSRMVLRFKESAIDVPRILEQMNSDAQYRRMFERLNGFSGSRLPFSSPVGIRPNEEYPGESSTQGRVPASGKLMLSGSNPATSQVATGYAPANNPQLFRCTPNPVSVTLATLLPTPTVDPDNAIRTAFRQLGLDNGAIDQFERGGSFVSVRPIARMFGASALEELLSRLRYNAQQIASPPSTYDRNAVLQRLGIRSFGDLLASRLLLTIPGHFRELARRVPNPREAHALENLGWLLMQSLRDKINTDTGISWWIPPSPAFVTFFANPLPPLNPVLQRLLLSSGLIDTTINYSDYNARFNVWDTGLAGGAWRLETTGPDPGRPFYAQLVSVHPIVGIAQERQQIDQVWSQRLADTDNRFAQYSNESSQALRRCDDGYLTALNLMQRATLKGMEMVSDFPARAGDRNDPARGSVSVLGALRPVFEQVFETVHEFGWNDLLFQTSGAGCFRGVKLPRDPNDPLRHHRAARRISNHSYGIAVDFNVFENTQNSSGSMDPRIVALFEAFHFQWGRCLPVPDPMHFEYCGGACR